MRYLEGNTSHPSALDVYKAVSAEYPSISFATVYNTLQMLRDRGEIMELTIDPDKKRFDPNPQPHHHLICLKCKTIVDIRSTLSFSIPEEERAGFEILWNHVDLYGLCGTCRGSVEEERAGGMAGQPA